MELFLLILCVLVTAADGNSAVRISVPGGSDVILPCSLSSKENLESKLFDWKKDDHMEVFFFENGITYGHGKTGQDKQFEGRVSHFRDELKNSNASIKITKTKVSDSGSYTCEFPKLQHRPKFSVQLVVGACPKPSTRRIELPNEKQALLECVVEEASVNPKVEWKDSSGKTLTAKEIKTGDSNKIILQTNVTKTGNYICVVTQEDICHRVQDDIYVSVNGAASEPYVTTLEETKDWSLLQCVVRGASPKPVVEWRDSFGNILPAKEAQVTERGGSYDIILQTTVTKSDTYSCVVTQTEVNHRIEATIHVFISGFPAGWIVTAAVFGVLFLVVGGVLLALLASGHIHCRKDEEKRETIKETESDLLPA